MASTQPQPNLVRLLFADGASPAVKDRKGKTPLDLARKAGHTGVVSLLTGAQNK